MTDSTAVNVVRVNDAELYHEVRGNGPAVLMIAGATGDAGYLAALADHLADEFNVVTSDRRGNSRSPRPPGGRRRRPRSRPTTQRAESLGLAPAALFGTSGGAIISLDLLVRHADVAACAVLHEPPMVTVLQRPEETGATLQALIEGGMLRGGPTAAAEDFLRYVSGGALDLVDGAVRERMLGNAETLFGIEFGVFESYRPADPTLTAVKVPVAVTTGQETLPFFREAASWLAARLGTEVNEVPGRHTPHFDKPREFADAIRPFLRETPTGGAWQR